MLNILSYYKSIVNMEEAIEFYIYFDKMMLTESLWRERLVVMERRAFFTKGLPAYFFKMGEAFAEASGMKKNPHDYFDSFESCYPLLSEVSYDMLVQAAEQLDIEVGNKDKMTLAREIYAVKGVKGFE